MTKWRKCLTSHGHDGGHFCSGVVSERSVLTDKQLEAYRAQEDQGPDPQKVIRSLTKAARPRPFLARSYAFT